MTGTLCKLCNKIIITEHPHSINHDIIDHIEQYHPDVYKLIMNLFD